MGFARAILRRLGLRLDEEGHEPTRARNLNATDLNVAPQVLRDALEGPLRNQLLLDEKVAERLGNDVPGTYARALLLVAWGRFREASLLYSSIVDLCDTNPALYVDAGWCFHLVGDYVKAKACMERAMALDPHCSETMFGLAAVNMALGCFAEAGAGFRNVAHSDPTYRDLWLNVGHVECALGNLVEAEEAAKNAIAQSDGSAAAWALLGQILRVSGRTSEALDACAKARACELASGENAGVAALQSATLVDSGRFDEAISLCEESLSTSPDPRVSGMYAIALLTRGYFLDGWRQYEFRWFEEPMRSVRVRYERPLWNGQPLAGKTIFLISEQGIGDVIQFARYASSLKAQGAMVVLGVHPGMGRLASGFRDVDSVTESPSPPIEFDYYASLMSLPRVLGTELGNVPAHIPYLSVVSVPDARWAQRLKADCLRVGVVWSGNPKHVRDRERSIPLRQLAPLWKQSGACFCVLQKEIRSSDVPFLPPQEVALNLAAALTDLSDTAAIVSELDVVISVDTAVAHLAGALGKPVWLLLPYVSDFRWLQDRVDSPWYPTMRIFRQRARGNWDSAIESVTSALAELVAGNKSALTLSSGMKEVPLARSVAVSARVPRIAEAREGIFEYLPNEDDEARSLEWFGEYLPLQVDSLTELLPKDAWVIDVGSGFGCHAVWFAGMMAANAQLFCYESRAVVRRLLRQNAEANRVAERITLPRGALDGHATMGAYEGPLHTIDHLRLQRLDLIKIASGRVGTILSGCERSLLRCRPRLVIDVESSEVTSEASERLKSLGYRIWQRHIPLYRPTNFAGELVDKSVGRVRKDLLAVPEEFDFMPSPILAPRLA